MSRIQPPPTPPPEDDYCGADLDDSPAENPVDVIFQHGSFMILAILLIQYLVLRCSNAVKKENICRVLFIGFLITFIVSVLSITLFMDQTVMVMEATFDSI